LIEQELVGQEGERFTEGQRAVGALFDIEYQLPAGGHRNYLWCRYFIGHSDEPIQCPKSWDLENVINGTMP
jgi:hypothetical protein